MEAKTILEQVKLFFNDLIAPPTPAPTPTVLNEYELKIGGKISIDKLEVGGIVTIDGAPAVPGELELMDGTKITVGDNGAITALTTATAPAEPPMFDAQVKFTELEGIANQKFADYEAKFAAYETKFKQYEAKMNKADKVIGELLKLSQLIVEAPAAPADPAARPAAFKAEKKETEYTPVLFGE